MKTSKKMQEVITGIAGKHDFDLATVGTYLWLEREHFDPLVIQVVGKNLVSVDHFYQPQPHLMIADPGILFFTGYAAWVPIEVMQQIGGLRICATLTPAYEAVAYVLPKPQADLAAFADTWAQNIKDQEWLEHGKRSDERIQP